MYCILNTNQLREPDPLARAGPYRFQYNAGAYTESDKALRVLKGLVHETRYA